MQNNMRKFGNEHRTALAKFTYMFVILLSDLFNMQPTTAAVSRAVRNASSVRDRHPTMKEVINNFSDHSDLHGFRHVRHSFGKL